VQPDISWLPISYDTSTAQGSYMFRMEPGAVTIAHDHRGMEEFLILEGDLVDDDGTEFGPGDFVSYDHGSHNSWTRNGCLIVVFEWQRPDGAATAVD
jgi:anti-sigma factor ChrR (cupin superfamily)